MQGRCLKWLVMIGPVVLIIIIVAVIISLAVGPSNSSEILPRALKELDASSTVPCAFNKDFQNVSIDDCQLAGCIWQDISVSDFPSPKCFWPKPDTHGYSVLATEQLEGVTHIRLKLLESSSLPFPDVKEDLDVEFVEYGADIFRIKITVPDEKRYEVPVPLNVPQKSRSPSAQYYVNFTNGQDSNFKIRVTRRSTNVIIFDTSIGGFTYADQFLQVSTTLPSSNLYGFGENSHYTFRHNMTYKTWPLFARDQGPSPGELNLYGSHPVYYVIEEDGNGHSVFWFNSNAMEIETLPNPGLTMRSIGGVMDLFFFMGPSPPQAVSQYMSVVGMPYFPPYWSLGFQLCRYGHPDLTDMEAAMQRTRRHGVPQDVQYADIDHMEDQMIFTIDQANFGNLSSLIEKKKAEGYRFIVILDPAVNAEKGASYPVHERALNRNVYITWPSNVDVADNFGQNNILLGYVWPLNRTAFPDWFKQNTSLWWKEEIRMFYDTIKFDGLWIDMNEPANFGTNQEQPWNWPENRLPWSLKCPNNTLDDPPYTTKAARIFGHNRLSDKTICMVGEQGENQEYSHYDVHNLYGWSQSPSTLEGLRAVTRKRGLVVSRSTFPSSGKYVGHWLGDNSATWNDLRASIIGMIEFNLFGIPYIGADICGFFGNTTEELCLRWMQLGAFYPYARNHNSIGYIDHDPGKWPKVGAVGRKSLMIRYRLLPYLYTLHFLASTRGEIVIGSLAFEFSDDTNVLGIADQFLWGKNLLIAPIVHEGETARNVYLPNCVWYDYSKGFKIMVDDNRIYQVTEENYNIPIFVRGGTIIPMQEPGANTAIARKKPLGLLISPNENNTATGLLYWDDGESIDTISRKNYFLAHLNYTEGEVSWEVKLPHVFSSPVKLGFLRVFNVTTRPYAIFKDKKRIVNADFHYMPKTQVLEIYDLDLEIGTSFTLSWKDEFHRYIPCPVSYNGGWNDTITLTSDKCVKPCLWNDTEQVKCRLPGLDEFGYKIASKSRSYDHGFRIKLQRINSSSLFGDDKIDVDFEVFQYSSYLLRFKFTDSADPNRYEVPLNLNIPENSKEVPIFDFILIDQNIGEPFAFYISRKDTGNIIFDTRVSGLMFADQFLSLTTLLPSKNIYGLGENNHKSYRHELSKTWPIFARDQPPEIKDIELNLYGSHPFYQVIENDGNAHGVLLLNSNAIDYQLLDLPAITFRTIGGILDFFLFMGPSPENVVSQYTQLVGRPVMPPYWGLGFHISRYGYKNTADMRATLERTWKHYIPLDSIFGDIDMMNRQMDFTIDPINFPDIPSFTDELHRKYNVKFVPILDPAINAEISPSQYPTYSQGFENDVYITWPANTPTAISYYNNANSSVILGYVWPENRTAFPDYLKDSTKEWWTNEIIQFHQTVKFDGLWIDMNEPAVFDTNLEKPWNWPQGRIPWNLKCPNNKWEDPLYVTKAASIGPSYRMSDKTLCLSSMHETYRHYDVHNLYGWSQTQITARVLQNVTGKRPFLISRSTFVGSGQWAGHWLGDNQADWEDMRRSIIGMLEFNLFGIPFVGADICGYFGNTTEEMCQRWMQLGAFYPFARNHNGIGNIDQDPGMWESVAESSKNILDIRYKLLPYLYTLFYLANTTGSTVVRPLSHEFPVERATYTIDTQFLWGSSLMISPVIIENAVTRDIYFPFDAWYDFRTGNPIEFAGEMISVRAPMNVIPLHVRGGSIIPMQEPGATSSESRHNAYSLLVALGLNRTATGQLFRDDGESTNALNSYQYDVIDFNFDQNELSALILTTGNYLKGLKLEQIDMYGIEYKPSRIFVNQDILDERSIFYDKKLLKLELKVFMPLNSNFTMNFEQLWL